jgi:hypothetical protein
MRAKPIKVWISDVLETNILGHAMVYVNKDMPEVELDIATNVYSTLQKSLLYLKAIEEKTNP